MPTKETATIYRCDHCKKYYSISSGATNYHEKICSANPKNKHACFGCVNLEFGHDENGVKCLICKAQNNKVMHSNKTAVKVARNFMGRKPVGELMPYGCALFIFKEDY